MFMQLDRNIKIRILTTFLTRCVEAMILPFMAIYFTQRLGAGIAGLLLLINLLLQITASLYGGYMADRYGRKKVMAYAQIIRFISVLVMTLANSPFLDSTWLTFSMMLLLSLCNGMFNPAAEAMLIDVSTKENRAFIYSINFWAINLSISIGAPIGGFLFATHRTELFMIMGLASLATLILTLFFIRETHFPDAESRRQYNGKGPIRNMALNYKLVAQDKLFIIYSVSGMLIRSLEIHLYNYISVRLQKEFEPQQLPMLDNFTFELTGIRLVSLLQVENTLIIVCLAIWAASFVRRFRPARIMYIGVILYTLGFTIVGFSNSVWLLLVSMLGATIGELMFTPIRQAYLAGIVKDQARSSYLAVNGLLGQFAGAFGAIGISLGAVLHSSYMAMIIFVMGMTGLLLTHYVFQRLAPGESRPQGSAPTAAKV
ncbi:MFS transporter, DHA1 family, multidrug resistance protein B [Paenibacillus algorifonticola]|uniref:MFS transporter, DHA1 family, multidrug resistance protein B n=1 Tax=Paenibacillus algorifonticola TaxID=684063 RepID=A0A1I2F873_9BACL|nr:MFS transporter [Paenibacillus algorifonticola]SFF00796.1 MFS transporter, DHA1 family, multidrug resistance protein B [Paenibacillus algorifonticola]